jgi:hypothetical protein
MVGASRKMMDLKQFMWRQQVRQLFRSAMKTAALAPEHARADLRSSIRAEFDAEQEVDERRQKFLAVTGRERISELRQMLGFQVLGSLEQRTSGSFKPGAF